MNAAKRRWPRRCLSPFGFELLEARLQFAGDLTFDASFSPDIRNVLDQAIFAKGHATAHLESSGLGFVLDLSGGNTTLFSVLADQLPASIKGVRVVDAGQFSIRGSRQFDFLNLTSVTQAQVSGIQIQYSLYAENVRELQADATQVPVTLAGTGLTVFYSPSFSNAVVISSTKELLLASPTNATAFSLVFLHPDFTAQLNFKVGDLTVYGGSSKQVDIVQRPYAPSVIPFLTAPPAPAGGDTTVVVAPPVVVPPPPVNGDGGAVIVPPPVVAPPVTLPPVDGAGAGTITVPPPTGGGAVDVGVPPPTSLPGTVVIMPPVVAAPPVVVVPPVKSPQSDLPPPNHTTLGLALAPGTILPTSTVLPLVIPDNSPGLTGTTLPPVNIVPDVPQSSTTAAASVSQALRGLVYLAGLHLISFDDSSRTQLALLLSRLTLSTGDTVVTRTTPAGLHSLAGSHWAEASSHSSATHREPVALNLSLPPLPVVKADPAASIRLLGFSPPLGPISGEEGLSFEVTARTYGTEVSPPPAKSCAGEEIAPRQLLLFRALEVPSTAPAAKRTALPAFGTWLMDQFQAEWTPGERTAVLISEPRPRTFLG